MFKKRLLAMCAVFFLVVLPVVFAKGIEIPSGTGLSEDSFAQVFDRVLNWMLMIFVILATMAFVITGLQFIFSFGGASGTQEAAKKNLTYTIIAIFIVGGALIILNTVAGLLGDAPTGSGNNNNSGGGFPFGQSGGSGKGGASSGGTAVGNTTTGNNTPFGSESGLSSPITNDPTATADPNNGGIYIQEGTTSAGSNAPGTVYQGNAGYDDSYEQN